MEKLKQLLTKLKEMHDVYVLCTDDQKSLLIEKAQRFFDELYTLGVQKDFSEALVRYGMEFILTEYGDPVEKLFGNLALPLTDEDDERARQMSMNNVIVWREHQGHVDVLLKRGQVPPSSFVTSREKHVNVLSSQQTLLDVESKRPT